MSDADLASAVALALTGERLPVRSIASLRDELAAAGYDPEDLGRRRAERRAAGLPWPWPVPIEERRLIGFARFDAALAEAREALGLSGLTPALRAERPLDRDEQRLAADRPPHW